MSINIADLYKMQSQILRPLSPRQEYALIVLLVPGTVGHDLQNLVDVVVREFPHAARLYDAFAADNEFDNALPFIVPVNNSEESISEIFQSVNRSLVVAPVLHQLLVQTIDAVLRTSESPQELRYATESEPLTVEWFIDCVLDAYTSGILPMSVRPSRSQQEQRADRMMKFRRTSNLFPGTVDYDTALKPAPTRALRMRKSQTEYAPKAYVNPLPN